MSIQKWPKILQLRQALREIPDGVHEFVGTVKLHGTNAGVSMTPDGEILAQSRNRKLSVGSDNFGFAAFVEERKNALKEYLSPGDVIYGEMVGMGICGGTAISTLSRRWVTFGKHTDGHFVPREGIHAPELDIYNIMEYPHFSITLDTSDTADLKAKLVELVLAVEEECPVGKAMGVTGDIFVGEGLVWSPKDQSTGLNSRHWFKTKGDKHSASKVRTVKDIDVGLLGLINVFVGDVITDVRCMQGVEYLKEMQLPVTKGSTGKYLQWIMKDVREEEGDVIAEQQLPKRQLNAHIGTRARQWYFSYLEGL